MKATNGDDVVGKMKGMKESVESQIIKVSETQVAGP